MFRKLSAGILIVFLFSACNVQLNKLVQQKKYDESLDVILDKLDNMPGNRKLITMLDEVYNKANKDDQDSIIELKKSGKPDIWPGVHRLYVRLDKRQEKLSSLPINIKEGIGYTHKDYDPDIEASMLRAMQYYYTHAKMLIKAGGKENGRKAFNELIRVASYHSEYKDTDKLMRHALLMGSDHVLIKIVNRSGKVMLPFFKNTVLNIELDPNQKKYLEYDLERVPGRAYDYTIRIVIDNFLLSPDRTRKEYIEYTADPGGEEGTIQCNLTTVIKSKTAMVVGKLDYVDFHTNKVMLKVPVRAKSLFKETSYRAEGDIRACPPAIQEKIKMKSRPFPSNDDMIKDVAAKFRNTVTSVIWNEEYLSN